MFMWIKFDGRLRKIRMQSYLKYKDTNVSITDVNADLRVDLTVVVGLMKKAERNHRLILRTMSIPVAARSKA